jgi:hypothetical protein
MEQWQRPRRRYFGGGYEFLVRSIFLDRLFGHAGRCSLPRELAGMQLEELNQVIRAAGGGKNALVYAEALLEKVNRVESAKQYAPLLDQLRAAREQGDFRGRVLEVNFADCFMCKNIILEYGVKQGMPGDIDFGWTVERCNVHIEMKLLGQDKATRDAINEQLNDRGTCATFVDDDTRDVARLQADLIQKASTRKFSPTPRADTINVVGIDVTELQLGTVDICDCLLAAGGNPLAAQHCNPACLRDPVVGVFETIAPERLSKTKADWIACVQKLPAGAPHPRSYLHAALFMFREPQERAALSYDLRAMVVWNPAIVPPDVAKRLCTALHVVIPQAR